MNVETVETVTGGIEATSPNFADVVDSWENYAQKTFSAGFADDDGYMLSKRNPGVSSPSTLGYYRDVTTLPSEGGTTEELYLAKRVRNSGGVFTNYDVKCSVPVGTTSAQLLDPNGTYKLTGSVFSSVKGGSWDASRDDYAGWYGTGLLNPEEYDADNIHASFRLKKGGKLNNGFAFMVNKSDSTYQPVDNSGNPIGERSNALSGYFFSYSSHNASNPRTLWRFDNWRLNNSFNAPNSLNEKAVWCFINHSELNTKLWKEVGATYTSPLGETITNLATWDNNAKNVDYDITCKDGRIKVQETQNGVTRTVADVEDATYTKGTYGFWGNNCEMSDEALVSNLNVEISKVFVKSFGDIVYEPAWTDGAPFAPQVPKRGYGIDAGEVLSMNVETVETSGVDASSPDFAKVVNDPANWEPYAQRTYKACFSDADGYILSRVAGTDPAAQGYYEDVTDLPAEGSATTEPYYLTKMLRYNGVAGHPDGSFKEYSVKGAAIPAGTTTEQLLDKGGAYRLNGSIYSYVTGGRTDGSRDDYAGWYGTALLNNNEYQADNIEASFKLVKGGNLNEGFGFMISKSDVTDVVHHNGRDIVVPRLSGYFMSVCCHNTRAVRTLWRIDDWILDMDSHGNAYYGGIWCGAGHGSRESLWYAGDQNSYIPQPRQTVSSPTTVTQKPTNVTALATWIDDAQNIDYSIKADGRSIKVVRKDNGRETDPNDRNTANNATSMGFPSLQTTKVDGAINFPNARDIEETVADIAITDNGDGTTSYHDSVSGKGSTVSRPNLTKGTYGFWGQNCEQGNQALITDLNVAITKTKSFGDIVYEPSWTDGALHMLINMDTKSDPTMLGKWQERESMIFVTKNM